MDLTSPQKLLMEMGEELRKVQEAFDGLEYAIVETGVLLEWWNDAYSLEGELEEKESLEDLRLRIKQGWAVVKDLGTPPFYGGGESDFFFGTKVETKFLTRLYSAVGTGETLNIAGFTYKARTDKWGRIVLMGDGAPRIIVGGNEVLQFILDNSGLVDDANYLNIWWDWMADT